MKQSLFHKAVVVATGVGLAHAVAFAAPWWQNPVIKVSADTGCSLSSVDPHYMNKDESDQYLFLPLPSANTSTPGLLYSIPALLSGTSSNDTPPIVSGTAAALYGNWKGGAVSDDLKRIITGNGVPAAVTHNASLPLTAPWTKDTTVFDITNTPSLWGMDGLDFSHTSAFLFSNIYNAGNRGKIVKWSVVDLARAGLALTSNTVFTTSVSRIRNVNSYYVGGKDLVYYGEGDDALGISPRKVCVYDPALGTETELATLNRTGEPGVLGSDLDIMNVKVGGVGLGQMHLYAQCNDGALYIYNLNSDGKSVGALARLFTVAEMKQLLVGSPTGTLGSSDRIRCLEFTNDEKYGFLCHKPNSGGALLHVLWTPPKETAWWQNPHLKYKEFGATAGPHYMNKDESDQYLFLSSSPGTTTPAYLYSIPALIAAASSNDVAPIATGTAAALYGNWKSGAVSDDLLRVLTGSGGSPVMVNASLPLTAPWTKDVTVFAITNDPATVQIDAFDFSHTSQYIYSDYYNTSRDKIIKWDVVGLTNNGVGIVTNTLYATTITRVRNVNVYFIGGKDLLYYGEGDTVAASDSKVCVFDPATETETVLVTGLPRGVIANDIMNVKVGGVGLGQMHLYVQCDGGAVSVYELNADGKSVGNLVRSFTREQTYAFLKSAPTTYMRSFEVTNDEKFAFFSFHGGNGLYVVWTGPQGTVLKIWP